ncbi:MAG: glycosyltransferase family 4 protein [Candidatus Methanoperedens sp.]
MKILVTSIVDLRKSAHNSRLHQFLKYLSERHEITVLSVNDWWKAKWDDKSIEYCNDLEKSLSGVKIRYLTEKKLSPILQEIFSIKTVNNILEEIEYKDFDVHFNYNTLISGFAVARKIQTAGINTIYDVADDLPEMIRTSPQINGLIRPIGGFVGDLAVKKNIDISKKITFTTESLRDSCDIPLNKSELIPNGVDTELFKEYPPDDIKKELGINNCFVVGHVGVLREWIDLETLFLAVKQLNEKLNIRLLIVGGGIGYEDSVVMAKKNGLLKNVIFTGTVPYTQVPKYISCMDVCVVPFKPDAVSQNSLPLKLFEYMACKKPVISTKVEGIIAAVQNRVLYASNVEEYKDRIIELYENEGLRRKLGYEGREIVEKNYEWSKITSRLEQVMEEVRGLE